jgi:hypothetical protein
MSAPKEELSSLDDLRLDERDVCRLCRVEGREEFGGYLLKRDGLWLDPALTEATAALTDAECKAIAELPGSGGAAPGLRLPCKLSEFERFLVDSGNYGAIDPFDMADLIARKLGVRPAIKRLRSREREATERNSTLTQRLRIAHLVLVAIATNGLKVEFEGRLGDAIPSIAEALDGLEVSRDHDTVRSCLQRAWEELSKERVKKGIVRAVG